MCRQPSIKLRCGHKTPYSCCVKQQRTMMRLLTFTGTMMGIALFVVLSSCTRSVAMASTINAEQHRLLHNKQSAAFQHQRKVTVQSNADTSIDIAWIHPDTGETIPMTTTTVSINVGDTVVLDTFVNHTFVLLPRQNNPLLQSTVAVGDETVQNVSGSGNQRSPTNNHDVTDATEDETSTERIALYLTITPEDVDQQVIVTRNGFLVERTLSMIDTSADASSMSSLSSTEVVKEKDATVEAMIELCRTQQYNIGNLTDMIHCVQQQTATKLVELNEELSYQRDLRRTMANMNEQYTCADIARTTTVPRQMTTWSYQEGTGRDDALPVTTTRNVGVLHEHHASQIHVIDDFISEDECMAIQSAAEPLLHRGTVADGKGGSTMSPNRKAWQAGIAVANDSSSSNRDTNDLIANVKRRIFAYTNHARPFNLSLDGQEDLMSIQYFGINSTAARASTTDSETTQDTILSTPDQYTPHCDGDCNNMVHTHGSRIATMVMYCTIPEHGGGGTNFQQSNVYIRPTVGTAVFFSYMDPNTLMHDEGYTTHSGCPVLYGTKRIVVQWMRYGVTSDHPWDAFDTNNVKIK